MLHRAQTPLALLLCVALPLLSACSATVPVRMNSSTPPSTEKAPLTVAWVQRPDDKGQPFKVGWSCFATPYVRFDDAAKAFGSILDGSFQNVLRTDDAKAAGADVIARANIDDSSVSLRLENAATGEDLMYYGRSIRQPWNSADTTLCTVYLMTLMWFLFPSEAKMVALRYAGGYSAETQTYFDQLGRYMPGFARDLAIQLQAAKHALPLEQEADAAMARGDKAQAFSLLARAAPGLKHDSKTGRRIIDKLIPLIPHGEAPEIPESARKLTVQGQTLFKTGKPAEAVDVFQKVLDLAPWWPSAWFNLGIAQEGSNNNKGAAATFERYLQAAPNDPDAEQIKKRAWALQVK